MNCFSCKTFLLFTNENIDVILRIVRFLFHENSICLQSLPNKFPLHFVTVRAVSEKKVNPYFRPRNHLHKSHAQVKASYQFRIAYVCSSLIIVYTLMNGCISCAFGLNCQSRNQSRRNTLWIPKKIIYNRNFIDSCCEVAQHTIN